jgi:hypothetical protein
MNIKAFILMPVHTGPQAFAEPSACGGIRLKRVFNEQDIDPFTWRLSF